MLILRGLKLALKSLVRFSSPTASGAILRGKYQHFGLNQFFKTSRSHNSVYNYEKKSLRNPNFKGSKLTRKTKIQFLLQSSSNVKRNTVWKLKILWGLKMHSQNKVEMGYVSKTNFLKRFL
jgi:hypothetical protein